MWSSSSKRCLHASSSAMHSVIMLILVSSACRLYLKHAMDSRWSYSELFVFSTKQDLLCTLPFIDVTIVFIPLVLDQLLCSCGNTWPVLLLVWLLLSSYGHSNVDCWVTVNSLLFWSCYLVRAGSLLLLFLLLPLLMVLRLSQWTDNCGCIILKLLVGTRHNQLDFFVWFCSEFRNVFSFLTLQNRLFC